MAEGREALFSFLHKTSYRKIYNSDVEEELRPFLKFSISKHILDFREQKNNWGEINFVFRSVSWLLQMTYMKERNHVIL